MKKLLLIALTLSMGQAQGYTLDYVCKEQGKKSTLKVDQDKSTLTWKGTVYKITETECGKAGWKVEKDGVSFDFCTATKGVADFDFNGHTVMCDMKR